MEGAAGPRRARSGRNNVYIANKVKKSQQRKEARNPESASSSDRKEDGSHDRVRGSDDNILEEFERDVKEHATDRVVV